MSESKDKRVRHEKREARIYMSCENEFVREEGVEIVYVRVRQRVRAHVKESV